MEVEQLEQLGHNDYEDREYPTVVFLYLLLYIGSRVTGRTWNRKDCLWLVSVCIVR